MEAFTWRRWETIHSASSTWGVEQGYGAFVWVGAGAGVVLCLLMQSTPDDRALDMAEQYPSAEVVGIDLSPIQPNW